MLQSLLTPQNITRMVAGAGILAVLNLTGIPALATLATVVAVGGGALATGQEGWNMVCELKQTIDRMNNARTAEALDDAGTHLARAIEHFGATAVSALLTHRASVKFVKDASLPAPEPAPHRPQPLPVTEPQPLPPESTHPAPVKPTPLEPDVQNTPRVGPSPPFPALFKKVIIVRPERVAHPDQRAPQMVFGTETDIPFFPKVRGRETLDVWIHGDPNEPNRLAFHDTNNKVVIYTVEQLAQKIKQEVAKQHAGPLPKNFMLRLNTCHGFDSGVAQNLANALQRPVLSPEGLLTAAKLSGTGRFPSGSRTILPGAVDDPTTNSLTAIGRYVLVKPQPRVKWP